jgi:hypothetical protein
MSEPFLANPARIELLRKGDVVAIYTDDRRHPVEGASVTRPIERDDFTPGGYVTLWTTLGRFDIPDDATVDVIAWAPMPANRAAVPL